jgi:hypothetical protein
MADVVSAGEFTMFSARSAITAGMSHIEEQVKAIERAVVENPGLAFDLAKTVVESACKTILVERKIEYGHDDDLPKLFGNVTTNLPMLPVTASSEIEARKSLLKTLNGLHTALQGVCELRNAYGFASHGSEGPRPAMESVQALLAAQAADAIVGFLHRLHRVEKAPESPRPSRSKTVDKVIDLNYEPVDIAGHFYAVSEALYGTDSKAYNVFASAVEESRSVHNELREKYREFIRSDIEQVTFVHFEDTVYLKIMDQEGKMDLVDTEFITDDGEDLTFSHSKTPDENAELLITVFEPESIVNCFDLFTEEGNSIIMQAKNAGTLSVLFPTSNTGGEVKHDS